MKNSFSYFGLKILVLLSHAMLLLVILLKGNYESLTDVIQLGAVVLGADFLYFIILKFLPQISYTLDMAFILLLGMSVLFQSCFGGIGVAWKHLIFCFAAFFISQISYAALQNPYPLDQQKWLLYLVFFGLVGVTLFCTGSRGIWIDLGFITLQPSEFIKPVFVLICGTTLARQMEKSEILGFHMAKDNLLVYFCTLVIMIMQWWCRDLGSLPTFLGIALLGVVNRICYPYAKLSKGKIFAFCFFGLSVAVFAFFYAPSYVQERLHADIWSDQQGSGYQQCRALIAIAEGGWFGKGPGNGSLHNVAASNTDIVFSSISEEWGLITALLAVALNVLLIASAVIHTSRTYYHSTICCGVAAVFTIQMALNIFGSCNLIPFTGVTIPFLSQGGSSMLSSGILVGFLKAAQSPKLKHESIEAA